MLRRCRDHHGNMTGQQIPFFDLAFLIPRHLPKYLSQVLARIAMQHLRPTLRHRWYVIGALPRRVAHHTSSFLLSLCPAAHDMGFPRNSRKCQAYTAPSRVGELPYGLEPTMTRLQREFLPNQRDTFTTDTHALREPYSTNARPN